MNARRWPTHGKDVASRGVVVRTGVSGPTPDSGDHRVNATPSPRLVNVATICECGADERDHHAPSIVPSGCIVSPSVRHKCPCRAVSGLSQPEGGPGNGYGYGDDGDGDGNGDGNGDGDGY